MTAQTEHPGEDGEAKHTDTTERSVERSERKVHKYACAKGRTGEGVTRRCAGRRAYVEQ